MICENDLNHDTQRSLQTPNRLGWVYQVNEVNVDSGRVYIFLKGVFLP